MILTSTALKYTPQRIVSLVPSQTELLHFLGLETETIGITRFCIHPQEWFKVKTRVGGTKALNIEKIRALKPDLIICNKEENDKNQVEILAKDFPVWVTDVYNLETAMRMIKDIGRLSGTGEQAQNLAAKIEEGFAVLAKEISAKKEIINAAYFIWKGPYMTIGGDTFINDMLERSGIKNIFSKEERYPEIILSDLQYLNCEVVLLSSEPYPFKQKHITELGRLLPGIKILLADGEMFSWYGSHLLKAPGYFRYLKQAILSENA